MTCLVLSLQQWVLLVFSFLSGLIALASSLGLSVSVVQAIIHKGRSLLTHCRFSNNTLDPSSHITYECPFDPTRIYVSCTICVCLFVWSFNNTRWYLIRVVCCGLLMSSRAPQSSCGCLSSWCQWWRWCSLSAASLSAPHSSTSVRAGEGLCGPGG